MDTLDIVRLAAKIAGFIESATQCSHFVKELEAFKKTAVEFQQDIDQWSYCIHQHIKEVHFDNSENTTILSDEEGILRHLCIRCELASSDILAQLQRHRDLPIEKDRRSGSYIDPSTAKQPDNGRSENQLLAIAKDLNESLAPRLWWSIDQMIHETAAKNSRLNASRRDDIANLTSKINQAFQELRKTTKELDATKNTAIWTDILLAVQKEFDYSAEQSILSELHFWTINRRQELISKEHENTFEWVFEKTQSQGSSRPGVTFKDWLIHEEAIYWISGKPGSGKSTLMKFIADNPKTMDGLKQWTGNDTLVTASFYFWSSAKDLLQKSDTGLLRSILFQILRQCPDLVQHAFPDVWQVAQSGRSLQRFGHVFSTTSELLGAFQRVSDLLPTMNVKFCFFIDGLDEYDGEPSDVVYLIDLLSKTRNLKACISSRPWQEFETRYGGSNPWKLYVHELTKNDMKTYTEDLFRNDKQFALIRRFGGVSNAQKLVESIVQSSGGVFLWVFLVVRSLLDGLTPAKDISDLRNELTAIPSDLEQYFEKMLLSIDEQFRRQTAQMFLTTLQAAEKLPLMSYWLMEEESSGSSLERRVQILSKEEATTRLRRMRERLNSRCQGLLKASNIERSHSLAMEEHEWLFGFRVDFLHRTAADFMQTAEMQLLLRKWSAETFNPDLEICKACLATINITPSTNVMFREPSRALSIIHLLLSHAKSLEHSGSREAQILLLDAFVSSMKLHNNVVGNIHEMILGPGNYWAYDSSFDFAILYHCASYGLGEYVILQLDSKDVDFQESPSGLLSGCLTKDPRVRTGRLTLNIDTIQLLLERGLDPNMPWGDRNFSFWQQLVTTTYSSYLKGAMTQSECDAIGCSMDYGADPKASVEVFNGRRVTQPKAVEIVEKMLPREQFLALKFPIGI